LAEDDCLDAESEASRNRESGLAIHVRGRGLQSGAYTKSDSQTSGNCLYLRALFARFGRVLFQDRLPGFYFGGRPESPSRCFDIAGRSGSTAHGP
jgi:hypothetical protein